MYKPKQKPVLIQKHCKDCNKQLTDVEYALSDKCFNCKRKNKNK